MWDVKDLENFKIATSEVPRTKQLLFSVLSQQATRTEQGFSKLRHLLCFGQVRDEEARRNFDENGGRGNGDRSQFRLHRLLRDLPCRLRRFSLPPLHASPNPYDMTHEYCLLQAEYKELEMVLTQPELNITSRRKHAGRKREVRSGIRRVEKFMTAVTNIQTALQLIMREVSNVEAVIFIFGNPRRPQYIYEMSFPHGTVVPQTQDHIGKKSHFADRLSRKVIREFTSKGVGSSSYTGPSKLFLLVKASSSFNMPQHFLPKRDFQYSKKRETATYRLKLVHRTCRSKMGTSNCVSPVASSSSLRDGTADDLVWFQCRHVIKGLACENPSPEE